MNRAIFHAACHEKAQTDSGQAVRQTLMVSMRAVELHNLMVLLLLLLVASGRHNSPFITLVAAACCDEKIAVAKYGS